MGTLDALTERQLGDNDTTCNVEVVIGDQQLNFKVVSSGEVFGPESSQQPVFAVSEECVVSAEDEDVMDNQMALNYGHNSEVLTSKSQSDGQGSVIIIQRASVDSIDQPKNTIRKSAGVFVCMFCGTGFQSAKAVSTHELTCTHDDEHADQKNQWVCDCGRVFESADELGIHMKVHELAGTPLGGSGSGDFVCKVCDRDFQSDQILKAHEATHSGIKPVRCDVCNKAFVRRRDMVVHKRVHQQKVDRIPRKKRSKPNEPDETTVEEPVLPSPPAEPKQRARRSGAGHKNISALARVVSNLPNEEGFQCHICTKTFGRINNYNIHMKLHESGRRFFCNVCGKWYRTKHEMLEHQQTCLQIQTGELVDPNKPLRYSCPYCNKLFQYKRDITIHQRVHTGEKPYACGYCGKGFGQSQALTIHIRTHTGEKPYNCSFCFQPFRDSSALRKHEFMKHTEQLVATALSGAPQPPPVAVSNGSESSTIILPPRPAVFTTIVAANENATGRAEGGGIRSESVAGRAAGAGRPESAAAAVKLERGHSAPVQTVTRPVFIAKARRTLQIDEECTRRLEEELDEVVFAINDDDF